ncbi:hypothetical protein [Streptomyces sp. MZ04]|uniref:hypothetical protein n=1 Tax=Streptomyces sp. MZ04 TaxID=2559236 RepID=UPI00107EE705|nr:hypothetical protein [Streptomyces sp. MZ04]TGA87564.1 hypothetical protein E2651_40515 [Streptomyces sp. MZ04]
MNLIRARRSLSPALAAASALLALTGCGSSSDSNGGDGKAPGKSDKEATASPNPAPAPAAQLHKALVTKADAKAKGYSAQDNTAPAVTPKSDKPQCRALADATASGTDRTPKAAAWASRSYGSTAAPPSRTPR